MRRNLLMLFIDGLGLGPRDPNTNPVFGGACPVLAGLLETNAFPVDATLGVQGLPQSATGTTSLLTGINAARMVGRHVEGFPGPTLRDVLSRENIFLKLRASGLKCAFANAYGACSQEEVSSSRLLSATTVAALSGIGRLRLLDELMAGKAVYQDLTREQLREKGFPVPLITPTEAAQDLTGIAEEHDFTLFEYFQTDRAGHGSDAKKKKKVLSLFDSFLATILRLCPARGISVILTSDHGNIEDGLSTGHTMNPVPLVVVDGIVSLAGASGARRAGEFFRAGRIKSLTDVAPAVVSWFCRNDGEKGDSAL